MTAMRVDAPGEPLRPVVQAIPSPLEGQVLIKVAACGVCRTDIHVIDGEIPARYPIVPGHEIVGRVCELGAGVRKLALGARVGVPWLGRTCGTCDYCRTERENLCDHPEFTGATLNGGYATHVVADAEYCFPLPDFLSDIQAAPLLCAGLIGWRALRLAGDGTRIGLYGFGAAAHILAQIIVAQGRRAFAFTRAQDDGGRAFALTLGCIWAGPSTERPPEPLDAAIIFAPAGELVPLALKAVRKGGKVVCAGIHMTDIPAFPYSDLWHERQILSVANLTREDGHSFLRNGEIAKIRIFTECFPLEEANAAIARLRKGALEGAAVLLPS